MPKLLCAALLLFATACNTTPAVDNRLENSPRHDEWVQLDSNGRKLHAYVVYPQVSTKAPAILVIHENRGLTDWVRTVADRLAENGYIAIAPDLLSGSGPNGGKTSDFPSEDAAREAISKLQPANVINDLQAAASYVRKLPSANGKLSVAGFCWGGSRTWDAANAIDDLTAAYVFYGTGPSSEAGVSGIEAPVYGFFGGDDARVNATIDATRAFMTQHGKRFEPVIYPGAGHAFMRLGEADDATDANRNAHDEAWKRWIGLPIG
jgi:carboxymethylenebutenolidase